MAATHRHTTIKSRIILIMTIFALLIAALLSYFSYELISFFQRKTSVQAAEFNLQLVANILEKDLYNLSALAMSNSTNSATNALIVDYFTSEQARGMDAIRAFNSMQEDLRSNHSNAYVRRHIATNHNGKFLHVANSIDLSKPLTIYNLHQMPGLYPDSSEQWERVVRDPFSNSSGIPFIFPIYDREGTRIGTVYLFTSLSVITDKLLGYALPSGSRLLLTLGENHYEINGEQVVPVSFDFVDTAYNSDYPTGEKTIVAPIRTEDGQRSLAVTYPVRDGVAITQMLATNQLTSLSNIWILLMIGVSFLVIALSGIITVYLTRTISNPVEKLKKRMDKIAQGHFSVDRKIEWNNELGDVGRGINRLSQDIVGLMESRLADEKQKQELEYRMLQSQINPHFLYNTLNSIKWMATIQNATGIAEMTTSLSKLLRSIAKDHRKLIPLKDELTFLDDYFLIQKYRYGSMISLTRHIESEELLSCPIPRFSLQPLIENAIFHGIEPKGVGLIAIGVKRGGASDVIVTIEDNGVGMDTEQIAGILPKHVSAEAGVISSVGLRSVNERLKLAFGDKYGLSIESEKGAFTKMIILLPGGERDVQIAYCR